MGAEGGSNPRVGDLQTINLIQEPRELPILFWGFLTMLIA